MIHYQTYTSNEAPKLVDLWNRSFGPDFPLDLRLWKQNVDACSRTFADASIVAVKDGHIIGAIIGKNPNKVSTIFVALEFRRQGIATELLERAEVAFTGELETTLVAGQDDRHFFPGIPEEAVEARSFFGARGFLASDGYSSDLKRSLTDWREPAPKLEIVNSFRELNIVLQPCSVELVPALLDHVEKNFSGRWLSDTRDRLAAEPDQSEIKVAVENKTDVIGFCHTFSNKSVVVGPSIYWRSLLGVNYGGLGPIGVSRERRKIGLGYELLKYSISEVAKTGATSMAIDWTGLVDFYGKAGFKVWKRYVSYTKNC
jgi:GNAT superfamily N-acetyltransferase